MTQQLLNILRDLPRIGTLVKDRGYRQVWRFEHESRGYYLKFYPRQRWSLRRLLRGSPAMREFFRLQALQKAGIPAPRAVALLNGLRLQDRLGDAVILEAIEPGITLDLYLNELELRGERAPNHLDLSRQLRTLVHQLGKAKLGHGDLHLGNFLLHNGKLYLLDAYAVRFGGLRLRDVMQLGHAVSGYATRADVKRGWDVLCPGRPMPQENPVSRKWWNQLVRRCTQENRYFGRLSIAGWHGHFFRQAKYPRRWSAVSRLEVTQKDWASAWEVLLEQIESEQLEVIKRTASGDVLAGEVVLGGRPVPVIIKRPRRKYAYRYVVDIFRGTRSRRAWKLAWSLVARGIPTAWPLALMEKRVLGYVVDQIIIFERVPGATLAKVDLDELPVDDRRTLMHRCGRLLRQLEGTGLYQYDSKSSNFIVLRDEKLGPIPVLIDVDGIRRLRYGAWSMGRLLRAMRDHPQYTPEDSLWLCRGYAPHAPLRQEPETSGG